jgi:hypothetical protein
LKSMALLGNYDSRFKVVGRYMGGNLLNDQCGWNLHPAVRNASFNDHASIPNGTTHPTAWHPARTGGGVASYTDLSSSIETQAAQLAAGKNLTANLDAAIALTNADLDQIVNLLADISASITTTTATLAAVAALEAAITASGTITTAQLGAIVGMLANLNGTGLLSANNFATASISADINSNTPLSPNSLAAAVWGALAIDNDEPGTMGELLNSSGAAANPWLEVIESGLTAAEVLRIILAVQAGKTNIVDNGGGSATVTFRDVADTKNRVEADMQDSERIDVTLDGG